MLTIYKASAGSGKTYTLALEYIRALLGVKNPETGTSRLNGAPGTRRRHHRHRAILAITFTNKATDEMKTRIVRELDTLAHDVSASGYTAELCRTLGCTPAQLSAEAATALHELLTDYRNFNVSTIDSFSQTILRTFAREVDRQGDYEIELNDKYAVAAGLGLMMDDLNFGSAPHEAQIRQWIDGFMREQMDNGRSFNVFQNSRNLSGDIVNYVLRMCSEKFKAHSRACLDYLEDTGRIQRYRAAVAAEAEALPARLREIAAGALEQLDAEADGRRKCRSALTGVLEAYAASRGDDSKLGLGKPESAKTYKKICLDGQPKDVWTASALPKVKGKAQYPPEGLTAVLADAARQLREGALRLRVLKMLASAARELEFLGLAWKYVAQYRRDNNVVLMSDTNDLVKRIINGSEVPFIYERTGMELKHFLIDEFQDTSRMQWDNLKPLLANGLQLHRADSLIIGDEKQAIYRFRNSDSSLLHHRVATDDFPHDHVLRGSAPADNTNHRSAHGIVRFNNALFGHLASDLGVEGYENVEQALFGRFDGLGSYVELRPAGQAGGEDADVPDTVLQATGEAIMRQHAAGYPWKKIAVLAATNNQVTHIVEYLMRSCPEIPLSSDEGLHLCRSAAVNLVVSILKYVDRSYGPEGHFDPDSAGYADHSDILLLMSRFEYAVSLDGSSLPEALDRAMHPEAAGRLAAEAETVRGAHASNLPALVEIIIGRCVPEALRRTEMAYLAAFQDCVLKYCSMYNPSAHAFLAWWDRMGAAQTLGSSDSLDAVRVMTIHKGKGLEWDCVHIPFASWRLAAKPETEWMPVERLGAGDPADRPPVLPLTTSALWTEMGPEFAARYNENKALQLADRLNMTYVAFTRPRRELTVHYGADTGVGAYIGRALAEAFPGQGQDGGVYIFGEPTRPEATPDVARAQGAESLEYCVYSRDDTRELTTIFDDTAPDEDDLEVGNEEPKALAEATRRGNELHEIMSRMRTRADLARAIMATARHSYMSPATRREYASIIGEAFDAEPELTGRWFGPGVRVMAERSIYVPAREMNFRPDRLVRYPDGSIDVVDYKFTSEQHAAHRGQVAHYMALLREMGLGPDIRGYLWYPLLRTVVRVE